MIDFTYLANSSTCLYGSLEGLPWKIGSMLITCESILKFVPLFRSAEIRVISLWRTGLA